METHATRSNISFAEGDQYAVLRLKCSKTDVYHSRVQIMLTATGISTCPVVALWNLFQTDPQPANASQFRLGFEAFSHQSVVVAFKKSLVQAGIKETGFSGYGFRKRAAQYAADQGMLDKSI